MGQLLIVVAIMMMAETTAMIAVCECSHQSSTSKKVRKRHKVNTNPLKTKDEANNKFEMKSPNEKYHKNAMQNKQY